MRCNQCNSENKAENKFCGQCGAPLASEVSPRQGPVPVLNTPVLRSFQEEVKSQDTVLKAAHEGRSSVTIPTPLSAVEARTAALSRGINESLAQLEESAEEPPISGPSFLGLDEKPPDSGPELAYLYEDEPKRSSGWIVALLLVLALCVGGYLWLRHPDTRARLAENARHSWAKLRGETPSRTNSTVDVPTQSQATATTAQTSSALAASEQQTQPSTLADNSAPVQPATVPVQASGTAQSVPPQPTVTVQPESKPAQPIAAAQPSVARTENASATSEHDNDEPSPKPKLASGVKSASLKVDRRPQAAPPVDAQQPGTALVKKAESYLYGKGVQKNCGQALEYLRAAADAGNVKARSKLGGLYATGNCVPFDRAAAYNWFMQARRNGARSPWLDQNISMLLREMTPAERARIGR